MESNLTLGNCMSLLSVFFKSSTSGDISEKLNKLLHFFSINSIIEAIEDYKVCYDNLCIWVDDLLVLLIMNEFNIYDHQFTVSTELVVTLREDLVENIELSDFVEKFNNYKND